MTPEETAEMAKNVEANRREAVAKAKPKVEKKAPKPKVVKASKAKAVKAAKVPKVKAPKAAKKVGPGTVKFKFKENRKPGQCDVLNCSVNNLKGVKRRCPKHKKIIRKAQLKANNVVWKKRVKNKEAGHHAVYTYDGKQLATRYSLKATDKVADVVKKGHSIIKEVGTFKAIVAKTKKMRAA